MDTSSPVLFGSLLREARRRKGLSQAELGGDKYSGSYISHIESGRRVATPEVIEFLSRRLGVSPLEWGVSPAADPAQLVVGDTIEDLLVAERAWSEHDWAAAIKHSSQAAAIAEATGDAGRFWEASYVHGQALFSSGAFAEAAALGEMLAEHEVAQRFAVARAQALSLAATAHRASDHLGWAVAFAARAVEAASSAPPIILAEALMALVSAMSEAGSTHTETTPYLDRLGELSPRLTSDHSRGTIAWTMGVAAYMAHEIDKGIALHEHARHWLDARRDFRLWSRFHSVAARWRLNAGVLPGTEELIATADVGLRILGNSYDIVELRQVKAMYALRRGDPLDAARIMSEVLDDPILGGEHMSRGGSELLLGHAFNDLGKVDAARERYARAALQFEVEGRLRAAVNAWRRSVGQEVSETFLTQG
ncbi:helix-turn-helix domain-containing protein [Propionicimonas sp.]|uniref:helix-turn-helix domain-containing protein n=1 Tax=Propionicimonas sp. TaxID=1955623 RepID=UPI0039E5240C